MVPPGDLKFYFTVNNKRMINTKMDVEDTDETSSINVPKTNIIKNIAQKGLLITKQYLSDLKAVPRPMGRPARPRPKSPWDVSKSVFKHYKNEPPAKLFEFDWD